MPRQIVVKYVRLTEGERCKKCQMPGRILFLDQTRHGPYCIDCFFAALNESITPKQQEFPV